MRDSKLICLAIGLLAATLSGRQARADDTEIFFGNPGNASSPNVLLIIDTSGSMSAEVTLGRIPYDSTKTYSASGCSSGNVYYYPSTSSKTPACGDSTIAKTDFFCSPATAAGGAFSTAGKYTGNAIRWFQETSKVAGVKKTIYRWEAYFSPDPGVNGVTYTSQPTVTCELDTDTKYPLIGSSNNNGDLWGSTTAPTSTSNNYYTDPAAVRTAYTFYDANYVAWLNDPTQSLNQTRLAIVKQAANTLIDSLSGVNVGIMRYSANGNGGMVIAEIQDVVKGAATLKAAINGLTANGNTPLAETLYEAYLYYSGSQVKYGASSTPVHSVAGSIVGGVAASSGSYYKSPITAACQSNYIVFLTDGLPNGDNDADALIEALDPKTTGCYKDSATMWTALGYTPVPTDKNPPVPTINYYDGTTGLCLKEQARVLYTKDLNTSSTFPGPQNVITHFIGFGNDVGAGAPMLYLSDAAKAGGGTAQTAANADELANAFDKAIGTVLNTSATFSSPSVAVDSFNKTQVLEDLYVAMFRPSKSTHWPGNLKKFKLRNGMIVGQDTAVNAVNPVTGFFTDAAKDYWQLPTDVNPDLTTKGGAANMIPSAAVAPTRNVYTYIGSNAPGALQALSAHPMTVANTAITSTLLALGPTDPTRDALINWAQGDLDGDLTTTNDIRHEMGDPIHSQPQIVIYGVNGVTTTDKLNDAVTFINSNDGYLHAIDVVSGKELWSYIPQELLGDLKNLHADAQATTKHYSLDGNLSVLRYDVKNDGAINPADGDRVFLYFSQGRGGERYYALDVTDKNNPKFMWSLGASDLSNIVHWSWSTPTIGRVKVGNGSAQNTQKFVLVFGGGYDPIEDVQTYNAADTMGNGLFMVDAVKGTVLWSQTKTATGAFANMTHAIPANVALLDTNNDGWADRMYVGDMAGQVWRFDITNGNSAASLVAGGVIASLGGKISPTTANNRSFYNEPDVTLITGGTSYYNIAIGSGDRAFPRSNVTTQDRFYALRDYKLGPMTQADYDGYTPIKDADLTTVDGVTPVTFASNSPGWKLPLTTGEKALAQSATAAGVTMFTTYVPATSASTTACTIASGSGRSYAINAKTALKYSTNLYESFATTGIPPSISIIDTNQLVRTDGSAGGGPGGGGGKTCLSGVKILDTCVDYGDKVKTFWRDASAP